MRGNVTIQATMLSLTTPDQLVPMEHTIRQIKPIVDRALASLHPAGASIERMPADRTLLHPE